MTSKESDPIASASAVKRLDRPRFDNSFQESVDAILRNQSASGAIVASPDFTQYHFCWLRDGSFSAYALDRAGEHEASARYHAWVNEAIGGISGIIDDVINKMVSGEQLDPSIMPPARFALDGTSVIDDWPNFQIDGYGTWLWSLGQHLIESNQSALPKELRSSVARAARYLATFALSPCYDVWEENGSAVHTSTLASVYGGLTSAAKLLDDPGLDESALVVKHRLREAVSNGVYVKSSENSDVDASELWLLTPFQAVVASDRTFVETVATIEDRLSLDGGLRRYPTDTYFGSGAWPVLTASLGWHHLNVGSIVQAQRCLDWLTERFDTDGHLGEQFGGERRDLRHYNEWRDRWGPPAVDLTWSHAMYVILADAIARGAAGSDSGLAATRSGTSDSASDVAT
ncbi:MAG TPA: glycoside hydrolase family 15 protein [Acidimicrobiales bacterium]|nr:glycoside hydrolase family 15 protein [Acidimicrobiales bacterium]